MSNNNPGERLLNILKNGRQYELGRPCKEIWAMLLSTEEQAPSFYSRLAKVIDLPRQIDEMFEKKFPDKREMQKHWLLPINTAFRMQNLSGTWESFSVHVTDNALDALAMAAHLIQTQLPAEDNTQDILWSVSSRLIGVLQEVENSGLKEEVKAAIFKALTRIIAAIEEYNIAGVSGVMDSLEMAVGHMFYDAEYREVMTNTEIGSRIKSVFQELAAIYAVAEGAVKIGKGAWEFLSKM